MQRYSHLEICAKTAINAAVRTSKFVPKDNRNLYGICLDFRATVQPLAVRLASKFLPNKIAPLLPRNLCWNYCTASWKSCQKAAVRPSRKSCPENLPFTVLTQLYGLAEMLPWNVCQAAACFSLLRNLLCSLALLLSICSWKNEWPFPPFPPLT